jgi:hypothetical protein
MPVRAKKPTRSGAVILRSAATKDLKSNGLETAYTKAVSFFEFYREKPLYLLE